MSATPVVETRKPSQTPRGVYVPRDALFVFELPGEGPVQHAPIGDLFGQYLSVSGVYETRGDLDVDLGHDEGSLALVYGDPTPDASGYYVKIGAEGGGSWLQTQISKGRRGDPGGNVMSIGTFTEAVSEELDISEGTESVRVSGFDAADDGGAAQYNVVGEEPDHEAKFQDAAGRWFSFSKGQTVRPQHFGATDSVTEASIAINRALQIGKATGMPVEIDRPFLFSGDMVGDTVRIIGANRDAGLKRINEVRTSLTSGFGAGGAAKVFTVASAAGLRVGMQVMFIDVAGGLFSPSDAFSHRNPVITAIVGNTVTVNPRSSIRAHAAGTVMQSAPRGLVLGDNSYVEGLLLDGNSENQTDVSWFSHNELTIEGSNVQVEGVTILNPPSDGILPAGPTLPPITNIKLIDVTILNAGCNGVHFGNAENLTVDNITVIGANLRNAGTNTGHQDGAVIFSDNCRYLSMKGGYIENARFGAGAFGSHDPDVKPGYPNVNDDIVVDGVTFRNCFYPIDVNLDTKRVKITKNTVFGGYPFAFGRWSTCAIHVFGLNNPDGIESPEMVTISDNILVNAHIELDLVSGAVLANNQIDNRGSEDDAALPNGYEIYNSSNVQISGGYVRGGLNGMLLQNGIGADWCHEIVVSGLTFDDQRQAAIHTISLGSPINAWIHSCTIRGRAEVAQPNWRGITFNAGLLVTYNDFKFDIGSKWTGAGSNTTDNHNRWMNRVNGVLDAAVQPYVPAAYPITARSGVTVADLSGGVYRIEKTALTDANDSDAVGSHIFEGDFDLLLRPKATAANRGILGMTEIDPATDGSYDRIIASINFFDGVATAFNNTGNLFDMGAYTADENWWITRRGTTICWYKGGATPADGALKYTYGFAVDQPLRFDSSIRTTGAKFEVRVFG